MPIIASGATVNATPPQMTVAAFCVCPPLCGSTMTIMDMLSGTSRIVRIHHIQIAYLYAPSAAQCMKTAPNRVLYNTAAARYAQSRSNRIPGYRHIARYAQSRASHVPYNENAVQYVKSSANRIPCNGPKSQYAKTTRIFVPYNEAVVRYAQSRANPCTVQRRATQPPHGTQNQAQITHHAANHNESAA